MKKEKKEKVVAGFKTYVFVMQEIWKLITILIIGILFGYLLKLKGPEGNHYIVYAIIISLVIGLLVFFAGLIRIIKKEEQLRQKEQTEDSSNEGSSIEEEIEESNHEETE